MTSGSLSINQWAEEDRPREKLARLGASALSNAELLAILIGSGTPEKSAVDLMKEILADCGNACRAAAIQGRGIGQGGDHSGRL